MQLLQSLFDFFATNFPSIGLISGLFPISVLCSFLVLFIAGICKRKYNWKTGYTRKLFHFAVFISAFIYQHYFGLPGVFILGWSVTLVVLISCLKGDNNLFYEALARENDAPFRTKYIIFSYLATFFGGVLSNLFFGQYAKFGYAVTGIADAIAEPVGTLFGKHRYRIFSFDKNKLSYRSLEGSFAVFAASFIVILIITFLANYLIFLPGLFLISLIICIAEAFSPSGFDNLILQLTASFLCSLLFIQA